MSVMTSTISSLEAELEGSHILAAAFLLGGISMIIIVFGGFFLEFLAFFLFAFHITIKKTQYFCTGFFYILMVGYSMDAVDLIVTIVGGFIEDKDHFYFTASSIFKLYLTLLMGPWNTLLALNRFSAVKYWKTYQIYWTGKYLSIILIIFLLYPMVVGGYLLKDFYCLNSFTNPSCVNTVNETRLVELISNGINVFLALILGISTAIATRLNLMSLTPETRTFERHLLLQSVISAFLFGGNLIFVFVLDIQKLKNFLGDDETIPNTMDLALIAVSGVYNIWFHISSTLLLFFVS